MRRSDWQPRLMEALAELSTGPFDLGSHDCAVGAARVADAISVDSDYEARLRQSFQYRTDQEVAEILLAGGGLQRLTTAFLGGQRPVPAGQLMQGDVALVEDFAGNKVLGVCEGMQVICAGVGPLPMSRVICGWRIA